MGDGETAFRACHNSVLVVYTYQTSCFCSMLQPNCLHCAEDALISDTCSSLEQNNTPTVSGLDGYLSQDRIMKNSVAKSAGPATSDGMQAGSAFVLVDLQFMQTLPNIQLVP
jgi:hypothetical protein